MARKAGDKVTIYEDPFSQEKPEGEATLFARESIGMDGEEQWLVKFHGDFELVSRCIYEKE